VLGFVAQNQTNISADSLGVAVIQPFREVLRPAALYIGVLDGLHFDLVGRRVFGKKRLLGSEKAQPLI
jgi:hypothetical protein